MASKRHTKLVVQTHGLCCSEPLYPSRPRFTWSSLMYCVLVMNNFAWYSNTYIPSYRKLVLIELRNYHKLQQKILPQFIHIQFVVILQTFSKNWFTLLTLFDLIVTRYDVRLSLIGLILEYMHSDQQPNHFTRFAVLLLQSKVPCCQNTLLC